MRNKYKTKKIFRTETEDRKTFPDIETARPDYAVYPELCLSSSHTFMYVQNYDTRDYQVEISLSSVTKNTLIIIPTGLGKTFIAAMLIINFYRWFPTGKIIFMATSRPLVKQQMDSIKRLNIISKRDIVEITGGVNQSIRTNYWQSSKVFFATPQTIQKDIERGVCPVSSIVLIVVDEAHHARGNHSYCQIIRKVAEITKFFRVIALTATPGSTVYDIQQVIYNLMVSQIEIRTDDDCAKYIHTRDIQSIVIQDAQGVSELSARLNSILQEYLEKLLKMSLVTSKDPTRTSKGKIAMLMKSQHNGEACVAIKQSIRLLNLREKLENYSIPFFTRDLEDFVNSTDRPIDDTNDELINLLQAAKRSPQEDPKMEKLCELVVNFLNTSSDKSKIIVFCSYRNVVKEIVKKLNEASPVIKCAEFVGQSSSAAGLRGLNQPKQLKVMDAFKRGIFNVLISTSIGEEGLDIGEVDLIICYDVQKSATRTIQRMGRTGRHQDGNVIFLLSEASKNLLHQAEKAPDSTSNLISKNMSDFIFYREGPKMNDNKLQIVFKKFTEEELRNYEKQISKEKEVKRAVLLTSELEELHEHHGESLAYRTLELDSSVDYIAGAVFCSRIAMSSESRILSDVYSSIFQSSVQCSPNLKSLSLSSQLSKNNNNNEEPEFVEKSPFAIDESSSQKVLSNLSSLSNFSEHNSSVRKQEKISVRKLLNLDMSTDTSASESDYEYDIFTSLKKKKKNSNVSEDDGYDIDNEVMPLNSISDNEIDSLKKSALKNLRDEVMDMLGENKKIKNKKNDSFQISSNSDSLPTNTTMASTKSDLIKKPSEPFKLLADIEEISSDSKSGNDSNGREKSSRKNAAENDYDFDNAFDGSGFIPPNTKSYNSVTSTSSTKNLMSSTSPKKFKKVEPNKLSKKANQNKSISLLSGSSSGYEEEEDQTSLSGFIVNSSEPSQNSQQYLRRISSDSSSFSSQDVKKKPSKKTIKNTTKSGIQKDDENILNFIKAPKVAGNKEEIDNKQNRNSDYSDSYSEGIKIESRFEKVSDVTNLGRRENEGQNDESEDLKTSNNNKDDFGGSDSDNEDDDVEPLTPEEFAEMTQNNQIQRETVSATNIVGGRSIPINHEKDENRDHELFRIFSNHELEEIIHKEEEKEEENNKQDSFLNSSSDDGYIIVMGSSSFVSTSSELIESESSEIDDSANNDNEKEYNYIDDFNDDDDENLNSSLRSLPNNKSNSSGNRSKMNLENNKFLNKIIEIEDEDDSNSSSDIEIKRKVTMSSVNYRNLLNSQHASENEDDSDDGFTVKDKANISVNNVSFVPLAKLMTDENLVQNLKKVEIRKNSTSSDSNFDGSSSG